MYYTYMLRCSDQSIYTGITTDLQRRFNEHKAQSEAGAKYTKSHLPLKIEAAWSSPSRSSASKLEYAIKRLSKAQKEIIIRDHTKFLSILGDKLNCNVYELVV
ncbi:MAG: GIY-YIG nuclease family protein [Firmicutes bacterium]|jgi:putative endonuclease|nr:GIY-YIG nuclease family protein [Bacillota bacterium]